MIYNIDDLDTVVDESYMDAISVASDFKSMAEKLPSEALLTLADETLLKQAREAYDAMDDYQKQFVDQSLVEKLETLEAKMESLKGETDADASGQPEGEN